MFFGIEFKRPLMNFFFVRMLALAQQLYTLAKLLRKTKEEKRQTKKGVIFLEIVIILNQYCPRDNVEWSGIAIKRVLVCPFY